LIEIKGIIKGECF